MSKRSFSVRIEMDSSQHINQYIKERIRAIEAVTMKYPPETVGILEISS